MYIVYRVHSESTSKYYTGQTDNLENRLERTNSLEIELQNGKKLPVSFRQKKIFLNVFKKPIY